jgi:integrase
MVSLGYGLDGKQIRKTTTFTPPEGVTPGKAEKLARAFAYEYEKKCQGVLNLNENMRFSELSDWYFDQIAPNKLKEATQYSTKKLIDLYVMPTIGHLKLKEISTARLDMMFNQLKDDGGLHKNYSLIKTDSIPQGTCKPTARLAKVSDATVYAVTRGGHICEDSAKKIAEALGKKLKELFYLSSEKGGLNPSTITRIRTATSSIFATALKKDIITKNPVRNATTPKVEYTKKLFLDESQCKLLLVILDEQENAQLKTAITTLLYTGMRSGELLALHWDDIDFKECTITINHTLARVNGEYKLTSPKTRTSERVIKMPTELRDLLKDHRRKQTERRIRLGSRWVDRGAVFTGEYGEYHNRTYLNSAFKQLLKKHGLPDVHVHDLRHANASLLINAGIPVKVISEHLGHRNTLTTENIYAHVFSETRAKASEAISIALGK